MKLYEFINPLGDNKGFVWLAKKYREARVAKDCSGKKWVVTIRVQFDVSQDRRVPRIRKHYSSLPPQPVVAQYSAAWVLRPRPRHRIMEMHLAPVLILFYYFPAELSRHLYDNARRRKFPHSLRLDTAAGESVSMRRAVALFLASLYAEQVALSYASLRSISSRDFPGCTGKAATFSDAATPLSLVDTCVESRRNRCTRRSLFPLREIPFLFKARVNETDDTVVPRWPPGHRSILCLSDIRIFVSRRRTCVRPLFRHGFTEIANIFHA